MRRAFFNYCIVSVVLLLSSLPCAAETPLETLLKSLDQQSVVDVRTIETREARFVDENQNLQQQLRSLEKSIAKARAEEVRLKKHIDANDEVISGLDKRITQQAGSLGELEGVIHQFVGDVSADFKQSLISAQYSQRLNKAKTLLTINGVPDYQELEDIWYLSLQDIVEGGRSVQFEAKVSRPDGEVYTTTVTRVGLMAAVNQQGQFLFLNNDDGSLAEYAVQPANDEVDIALDYVNSSDESWSLMVIDPTRGQLLSTFSERLSLLQRFRQGNVIGVVIAMIFIAGLLIAIERYISLSRLEVSMRSQVDMDEAKTENPLGRILSLSQNTHISPDLLERKIDEEIFRESAGLEKRISLIKMFAVIAPMLGLLGTVTGMIETFQSITLFGSGDPKMMAGGISQALVTTALGLIAAIPLLFMHNLVRTRSNNCVSILEEQSAGLLVRHMEKAN